MYDFENNIDLLKNSVELYSDWYSESDEDFENFMKIVADNKYDVEFLRFSL